MIPLALFECDSQKENDIISLNVYDDLDVTIVHNILTIGII